MALRHPRHSVYAQLRLLALARSSRTTSSLSVSSTAPPAPPPRIRCRSSRAGTTALLRLPKILFLLSLSFLLSSPDRCCIIHVLPNLFCKYLILLWNEASHFCQARVSRVAVLGTQKTRMTHGTFQVRLVDRTHIMVSSLVINWSMTKKRRSALTLRKDISKSVQEMTTAVFSAEGTEGHRSC
ncbi:uncharacterized protein [Triticum aestivum]|uniref:uncharacterized protein isoform X2 n=1 Tax=Triticum aestivum TaxID=4565 RepID=UPI000843F6E8|nr:uncharacterized protein LOC123062961 isoform X2 [Triticum aestivum]